MRWFQDVSNVEITNMSESIQEQMKKIIRYNRFDKPTPV